MVAPQTEPKKPTSDEIDALINNLRTGIQGIRLEIEELEVGGGDPTYLQGVAFGMTETVYAIQRWAKIVRGA